MAMNGGIAALPMYDWPELCTLGIVGLWRCEAADYVPLADRVRTGIQLA